MEELAILRTFAAVAGFTIFIVASIAWMLDGWLESEASRHPEHYPSPD